MHTTLVMLLALAGAETQGAHAQISDYHEYTSSGLYAEGCTSCQGGAETVPVGHLGFGEKALARKTLRKERHTMPQTCYQPRYGCYFGGERHMHRYPAFHGYYYRRPYNYRHVFDYPWHAQPHEPTSLYSHNVGSEEQPGQVMEQVALPPVPPVEEGAQRQLPAAAGTLEQPMAAGVTPASLER